MSKVKMTLRVILLIIFILSLFFGFFLSTFCILVAIADEVRSEHTYFDEFVHEYFSAISIITPFIFTLLFIHIYKKRKDFVNFIGVWLAILFSSFFISSLLAYSFGNSETWYLKYTLGLFIGVISYFLNKNRNNKHVAMLTGIFSVFALFWGEQVEYLIAFDPSNYPTTIYINSFPNKFVWLIFILLVVIPSSFLSKGFLINRFFKQEKTNKDILT